MPRFASIQVMRAVAALAVLLFHQSLLSIGYAGVDIFFVISGFIMGSVGERERPGDFMAHRLIRIVPLYWAVTLGMCLMAFVPGLFANFTFDGPSLLKSLFFIPYAQPNGEIWPLVVPGWTLNYEMLFYLVFWLGLVARRPLIVTALLLGSLIFSGLIFHPQNAVWRSWSDPLLLEFVAGLVLSRLDWLRGRAVGGGLLLLGVLGYGLAAYIGGDTGAWRPIILGLPAFALVSGALALERANAWPNLRPLERIGDWSYSLYLLHGLAMKAVEKPLASLPLAALSWLAVPLGILASLALAYASYRFFERPVGRSLRHLLHRRPPAVRNGVAGREIGA
ncbi:MAG TPA: acyltransferase [Dongiaceae bacterium]|nr:acyltransferase [Dongiaceae bacterium]